MILIASVGGSKRFQGYAVMLEKVVLPQEGEEPSLEKKEGGMAMTMPFKIEWVKKYVLFFFFLNEIFSDPFRYPNLASCPGLHFSLTESLVNPISSLSVNLNKNCQVNLAFPLRS